MIERFAHAFQEHENDLRAKYARKGPGSYEGIFTDVVELLAEHAAYPKPDPKQITALDHGDYQGTHVFVVPEDGYQPSTYFVAKVGYGSCSGCDSFEAIQDTSRYGSGPTPPQAIEDYVTLARHLVQSMVEV